MIKRKISIKRVERRRLKSLGEKPSSFFKVKGFEHNEKLFEKRFPSKKKAEAFAESQRKRFKRMGK